MSCPQEVGPCVSEALDSGVVRCWAILLAPGVGHAVLMKPRQSTSLRLRQEATSRVLTFVGRETTALSVTRSHPTSDVLQHARGNDQGQVRLQPGQTRGVGLRIRVFKVVRCVNGFANKCAYMQSMTRYNNHGCGIRRGSMERDGLGQHLFAYA